MNPGGVENLRLAKTCLKPGLRSPQSDLSGVWRRDHTSCAVLIIVQPIRGQTQSWASNCNRLGAELRSVGVWEPRVTITLNRDQSYSQGQSVGAWLATGHWGDAFISFGVLSLAIIVDFLGSDWLNTGRQPPTRRRRCHDRERKTKSSW